MHVTSDLFVASSRIHLIIVELDLPQTRIENPCTEIRNQSNKNEAIPGNLNQINLTLFQADQNLVTSRTTVAAHQIQTRWAAG